MYERQVSSETPYIVKLKLIQSTLYKVTSETLDFHPCKQNPTSDTPYKNMDSRLFLSWISF